jgi:hypothetical protein
MLSLVYTPELNLQTQVYWNHIQICGPPDDRIPVMQQIFHQAEFFREAFLGNRVHCRSLNPQDVNYLLKLLSLEGAREFHLRDMRHVITVPLRERFVRRTMEIHGQTRARARLHLFTAVFFSWAFKFASGPVGRFPVNQWSRKRGPTIETMSPTRKVLAETLQLGASSRRPPAIARGWSDLRRKHIRVRPPTQAGCDRRRALLRALTSVENH